MHFLPLNQQHQSIEGIKGIQPLRKPVFVKIGRIEREPVSPSLVKMSLSVDVAVILCFLQFCGHVLCIANSFSFLFVV